MEKRPFDIIETERLVLKPVEATFPNAVMVYDLIKKNWDHLTKFLTGLLKLKSPEGEFVFLEENKQSWEKQERCAYGIYTKEGQFIGTCDVFGIDYKREAAELGFMLFQDFTGKGYMTETIKAVTDNFFKRGFYRLSAIMDTENIPSEKVVLRCGFVKEGVLRGWRYNPTLKSYRNVYCYSKIRPDWEKEQ